MSYYKDQTNIQLIERLMSLANELAYNEDLDDDNGDASYLLHSITGIVTELEDRVTTTDEV